MIKSNLNSKLFFLIKVFIICLIVCLKSYSDDSIVQKNMVVMGRNTQLSIEDENGLQTAVYKVPYGSKLFYQNGDKVKKNIKIKRLEFDKMDNP